MLRRPEAVFADEALLGRVLELGGAWRKDTVPAPSRDQLLRMMST